jgi:hypothetical protein
MIGSTSRPSPRDPININVPNGDAEEANLDQMIEWLKCKRSLFGLGKKEQKLVHSLRDDDSRSKMANVYAAKINGFKKTPDVTIVPGGKITEEMVQLLKEYELPTSYPARTNLPVAPPPETIHSTGLVAESAVMLFNQIIVQFIPMIVRIKYYALCYPVQAAELHKIAQDIVDIIETSTPKLAGTPFQIAVEVRSEIANYIKVNKIDMVTIMQRLAADIIAGSNSKEAYAVRDAIALLETARSYLYVRTVIKQIYCLVVNEVKVYQAYDHKQACFKQAEAKYTPNVTEDIRAQIVTGAILPCGIAKSVTIVPVNRLNMSEDNVQESHVAVMQAESIDQADVVIKPSIARYRLVCKRSGYTLSAIDRYAPQIFLNIKYVCDMDVEFLVNAEGVGYIYRINKPTGQYNVDCDPMPYDKSKIEELNGKIRIRLRSHLGNVKQHTAALIEDKYTQSNMYEKFQYIVGAYDVEENGALMKTASGNFPDYDVFNSSEYNIIYSPAKKKNLPNRTIINRICQSSIMEDFVPGKPPMNFYGIVYEDFDHDYPDYLHYNYPYFCAYDITSYEETNALDARKYYISRKKKRNADTQRKRRRFKTTADDYD